MCVFIATIIFQYVTIILIIFVTIILIASVIIHIMSNTELIFVLVFIPQIMPIAISITGDSSFQQRTGGSTQSGITKVSPPNAGPATTVPSEQALQMYICLPAGVLIYLRGLFANATLYVPFPYPRKCGSNSDLFYYLSKTHYSNYVLIKLIIALTY